MTSKISFSALALSVVVGCIIIIGTAWLTGRTLATGLVPTMAMLSGFVVTGLIIGIISKDITILEPGIGAIIVSIIAIIVVPSMELKSFAGFVPEHWILIMLHGIALTFVGSWVGEMLQNGIIDPKKTNFPAFEWAWIIAGVIIGLVFSLIILSILFIAVTVNHIIYFAIPFFISLFITGLIVGWMSPGITIKEAGIAGFMTIILNVDLAQIILGQPVGLLYLIGALVLGIMFSLFGGVVGEKIQVVRNSAT